MRHSDAGPSPEKTSLSTEKAAPGLVLSDIVVRSDDGARLVGPASAQLAGGQWIALLGRSGVGKSTLLRAIAGLIAPKNLSGAVRADDGAPLSGRIAWMAQDPLLAPWASAWANVAIGDQLRGGAIDREAVDRALRDVGLAGKASRRPAALSGGEQQRVALARTLYEDRPIALLDEAFSALDALTRDEIATLAAQRLRGRTVLQVTHDPMEAARLADRILILNADGDRLIDAPLGAAASTPTPRPHDAPSVFALGVDLRHALLKHETRG